MIGKILYSALKSNGKILISRHNFIGKIPLPEDKGVNLGSAYETAAAMELIAHGHELYYFDSKKVGEVDFLINDYDNLSILPIEIKSGKDQTNFSNYGRSIITRKTS